MCEIAIAIQQKGGYEVLWAYLIYYPYFGRVMPLNADTAEQLVQTVADGCNDWWRIADKVDRFWRRHQQRLAPCEM